MDLEELLAVGISAPPIPRSQKGKKWIARTSARVAYVIAYFTCPGRRVTAVFLMGVQATLYSVHTASPVFSSTFGLNTLEF